MRSLILVLALLAPGLARAEAAPFIRGDTNLDHSVDISDAIRTLGVLFLGEEPLDTCPDAMDANDDGALDISDASFALNFLFSGGAAPPAPFPGCGFDATDTDALTCAAYPTHASCPAAHDCFEQAELDALVTDNVPPVTCLTVEAAEFVALGITVLVCPQAQATPRCGGGTATGCPISITGVQGSVDLAAEQALVHIEGLADDLPVSATSTSTVICLADMPFSGDAVIDLQLEEIDGGVFEVKAILGLAFENVDLSLSATGGGICTLLASSVALIEPLIISELELAANELLADLSAELVGTILCAGE